MEIKQTELRSIQADLSWVEEQIELIKRKRVYLKRNKIIKHKKLKHLENIRDTLRTTVMFYGLLLRNVKERVDKMLDNKDDNGKLWR